MSKHPIAIDCETLPRLPGLAPSLKLVGAHAYLEHAYPAVVSIARHNGGTSFVFPTYDEYLAAEAARAEIKRQIEEASEVVIHNLAFDSTALAGFCGIGSKARCSMVLARSMGLPGALAALAPLVKAEKDESGNKLAVDMQSQDTLPTKDQLERLRDYCDSDARITLDLWMRLIALARTAPSFASYEKDLWQELYADMAVNGRGVPLDKELVEQNAAALDEIAARLNYQVGFWTKQEVPKATLTKRIAKWANEQLPLELRMHDEALAKSRACLERLLKHAQSCESMIGVCTVLEAGIGALDLTAAAKWKKAREIVSEQGSSRIRNGYSFMTAMTGRWTSHGLQLHNFKSSKRTERAAETDASKLSSSLRSMVKAPEGKILVAADYKQIELRLTLAIARQREALKLLEEGNDLYLDTASRIFDKPIEDITDRERFIAKTAVLSLGYGAGSTKLAEAIGAENAAIAGQVHGAYHSLYPGIKRSWRQAEDAFDKATNYLEDGKAAKWAELSPFRFTKTKAAIAMELPSGRCIWYWRPQHHIEDTGWSTRTYVKPNGYRTRTWGGTLVENMAQAVSRDCLAAAIAELAEYDKPGLGTSVVAHTHDEIVLEVPDDGNPEEHVAGISAVMKHAASKASGWLEAEHDVECSYGPRWS